MSVYIGSSETDENSYHLAQLLAGSVSREYVRKILSEVAEPYIGDIRYTVSEQYPVVSHICSYDEIPSGFDGWVFANGCEISKNLFGEAYALFHDLQYQPKQDSGSTITIPNLIKFMRFSSGKVTPFREYVSRYSMPSHVHDLGDPTATSLTQTIDRCAYIWSTGVDESESGGKMPEIGPNVVSFGGKTFDKGIPSAPSAHRGGTTSWNGGDWTYVSWDVPIDTSYITGETEFKCDTGEVGVAIASCEPSHSTAYVQIYIGKVNV